MTGSAGFDIEIERGAPRDAEAIEQHLLAALRENDPPSDVRPLTLVARDGDGALVAGLAGSTAYGWLLIKALWVAKDRRGQGLGAALVRQAETAARSDGCHGAWLDTSSRRAESFYRRLGYKTFGTLENRPGELPRGHGRHFLCKRFAA